MHARKCTGPIRGRGCSAVQGPSKITREFTRNRIRCPRLVARHPPLYSLITARRGCREPGPPPISRSPSSGNPQRSRADNCRHDRLCQAERVCCAECDTFTVRLETSPVTMSTQNAVNPALQAPLCGSLGDQEQISPACGARRAGRTRASAVSAASRGGRRGRAPFADDRPGDAGQGTALAFVSDEDAVRAANELVGPPIDSHVSRAYASAPTLPVDLERIAARLAGAA